MALTLRDRLRAGLGTAEEWLRDRHADLAHGAADLEAEGHELYGQAIRARKDVVARTTSELRELAKSARQQASRPSQPAGGRASSAAPRDRNQQILENARRITADAQKKAQAAIARAAASEPVRQVAGNAARVAGNAVGIVTSAVDMGHNLVDGAVLAGRLLDVTDPFRSAPGEAAWDEVVGGAGAIAGAVRKAAMNPRGAAKDIANETGRLIRDTDPRFTPTAPTLAGEIDRNFQIGRRQGEVGMEVLPYAIGAGELKATAELGALSKAGRVEKYLKQGFNPRDAAYLAEPYKGMGHHSIIPRRTTLFGMPVPKAIMDSHFNVLEPPGISRGDMYELHYKVDPSFKGAGLGRRPGWSGRRIGLQEYEGPARIWYGTPNATKRAAAGVGMAATVPFGDDPQP